MDGISIKQIIRKLLDDFVLIIIFVLIGIWIGKNLFNKPPDSYPVPIVFRDTIEVSSGRDTIPYFSPITVINPPVEIQPIHEEMNLEDVYRIYKIEYYGHSYDAGDIFIYGFTKTDTMRFRHKDVRSPFTITSATNGVVVRSRRNFPIWEKLYIDITYDILNKDIAYIELGTGLSWKCIAFYGFVNFQPQKISSGIKIRLKL